MSLPEEKKDKLAKDLADNIVKETRRHYKTMREHEVTKDDAVDVVRKSFRLTPNPDRIFKDES